MLPWSTRPPLLRGTPRGDAVETPCPPGSTPTIRTRRSLMNGQKRPMALDPPPTQATMTSGSFPPSFRICARASSR